MLEKYLPRGLQARLILVFFVVVLMPLIGIGLYGHFFVTDTLKQMAFESASVEVHQQAQHIVQTLETGYNNLRAMEQLGSMEMLRRALDENVTDTRIFRDAVAHDFTIFSQSAPIYYQIAYVSRSGDEIVRVDLDDAGPHVVPPDEGLSRAGLDYFQKTMALDAGDVYASSLDPIRRETAGDAEIVPTIHYGLKLANDGGAIIITLYASEVFRNLDSEHEGDGYWSLVDQAGRFLLYSDQARQSGSANSGDQPADLQAVYPEAGSLLSGGFGVVETMTDVVAYNTIYPVAADNAHFWVILRATPKEIIFADIDAFHRTATFFYLGALITALALALNASDHIVTPLRNLQQTVTAFGQGSPPLTPPTHLPPNEIGALTHAFYDMAAELDSKRQQQRTLIEKLIKAQEEERKLVAYDLHDGLLQQMIGARFHLLKNRRNGSADHEPVPESLQRGCDVLSEAIVEGRRIIQGLHPTVLDDLGLAAALKELAETTSDAANWDLELDLAALPAEPERALSVTIYRIAQEALNNVRKHARATRVSLTLRNHDGLRLIIRDNGQGFDLASVTGDKRGLGLSTMRERANMLEGRCEIVSAPDAGTSIQVWLPWKEEEYTP